MRIWWAFNKALVWTLLVVAFVSYAHAHPLIDSTDKGHPVNTAAALIAAHDCWTGAQPADVKIAGHVVVTIALHSGKNQGIETLTTIYSADLVDIALDVKFNNSKVYKPVGTFIIHAFCK